MATPTEEQLEATVFRQLLPLLTQGRGDTSDWPLVLLELLKLEFNRTRRVWYGGGRVLVDRDEKDHAEAVSPEKSKTRMLFKKCRDESQGCLQIDGEVYWLVSYEIPCFGKKSHQCADLVGLTETGGLVVFECKLKNSYAPITAVIEGLDYLSCLTAEPNFSQLQREFEEWRQKSTQIAPVDFEDVSPQSKSCHEVIVLATSEYFDHYRTNPDRRRNTQRGTGWSDFAAACAINTHSPRIRFAVTEFTETSAQWVNR